MSFDVFPINYFPPLSQEWLMVFKKILSGQEGFRADEIKPSAVEKLQNETIGRYWLKRALAKSDPEGDLTGTYSLYPESVSG
jgi:hypothetical protein